MTLKEAIKKLTSLGEGKFAGSLAEEEEAQKLGTEALKRWEAHRNECPGCFGELLPGETRE